MRLFDRVAAVDPFTAAVLAAMAAYVALALTPSSYAIALSFLGVPPAEHGLYFGIPHLLRSDEWAVWTPYMQAAVNNHFGRINATSVYLEDLRNFNALPLLDWALPFKPQFWAFFLIDPAYAFSLHHAFFIAAFLLGYDRLFRLLGFPRVWSVSASLLLFGTSYTQFSWTTTGPLLALFPWPLIAYLGCRSPLLRFALLTYSNAVWLISHGYPPVIIGLGIAGVALIVGLRSDTLGWRRVLPAFAAFAVALGIVALYLGDAIAVMASTVYPGARNESGGSVPFAIWIGQFLPFYVRQGWWNNFVDLNVVPKAVAGSFLPLLCLCFLDYRAFATQFLGGDPASRTRRRAAAVLLAGLTLMTIWMLVPVPARLGRVLLLHLVPPDRLAFPVGILATALALFLLREAGVRLAWHRAALLAALALAGWWMTAPSAAPEVAGYRWIDLSAPALALLVVALCRHRHAAAAPALIGLAALANLIGMGSFNPVQSAKPIFHVPETPLIHQLREVADAHPKGWLVAEVQWLGAVFNGLGFKSVSHVLIAPQLAFFRGYFPNLPPAEFDRIFNRSAHIYVFEGTSPQLMQSNVVQVPEAAFAADVATFSQSVGPYR